jgi:hypothetical protein
MRRFQRALETINNDFIELELKLIRELMDFMGEHKPVKPRRPQDTKHD